MVETQIIQDKETIELTKNTKCYTWSIKVKAVMLTQVDLDRLQDIDSKLNKLYGGFANGN